MEHRTSEGHSQTIHKFDDLHDEHSQTKEHLMSQPLLIAADLIAITLLVSVYFHRYHRRDMIVAILGLNVGVMAVATALSTVEVSAGLGLGLFGVLSIIRLRSSELAQEEVAYYFTALALGLLAGIAVTPAWLTPALMGAVLAVLIIGDHPQLFPRNRHQMMTIDKAFTNEAALRSHLELLLAADICRLNVVKVNLVNDSTVVDVRFRLKDSAVETVGGESLETWANDPRHDALIEAGQ